MYNQGLFLFVLGCLLGLIGTVTIMYLWHRAMIRLELVSFAAMLSKRCNLSVQYEVDVYLRHGGNDGS